MSNWYKKLRIIRDYDESAKVYDAQYASEQNTKIREALSDINLSEDSYVLDVGCGTGLLFNHIGGSIRFLVGLDVSFEILKEAKKHIKRLPNIALIRADADLMPFKRCVFDTVFAITLLQNMPNPLSTLHEIKRVGKCQSIIVVTGLKKRFSQEVFIRLIEEAGLNISLVKANDFLKGFVVMTVNSKTVKQ